MRKHFFCLLLLISLTAPAAATAQPRTAPPPTATFTISYSPSAATGPLTGRMFLIIAHTDSIEPRLQVGRYGTQFFGVDFTALHPNQTVKIDGATLGYPIANLINLPAGDYYIQAVLDKYTEFKRSDGHTLWMHMDQWEGQDWRRSPGNLTSKTMKVTISNKDPQSISLTVDLI